MAIAQNIQTGGSTAGQANVDANFNLNVVLPQAIAQAGSAVAGSQQGDGTYTAGTVARRVLRQSSLNKLAAGFDTPMFDYAFVSTSQDTGVWSFKATTMTMAQSGGFLVFNNNTTLTTATGCSMQTFRQFTLQQPGGLKVKFQGLISGAPPANQIIEAGLFLQTVTAAPADGIYFRVTSAGITGVLNYNGTETTSVFSNTAYNTYFGVANVSSDLWFEASNEQVDFYVGQQFLGSIAVPAANNYPFLSAGLPVCIQQRNSGAVVGATQFKLSHVSVAQVDIDLAIPFNHIQGAMGLVGSQAPQAQTMGSTALFTNNLAAGAGSVLTNTTAAAGTGLGGQFSVQPTLAAGTDGILCSYLNPAGSPTAPPRVFMCTGVRVQGAVTTVLAGGPVIFAYSLAYGHTALSMVTAEGTSFTTSPTTKAPRRVPIGIETYAATAAVGVLGSPDGVKMQFLSPIPVNPSEYIAICAKNLGTVTSSGVITCLVTFDGYWI